jgi:hypothetical protein
MTDDPVIALPLNFAMHGIAFDYMLAPVVIDNDQQMSEFNLVGTTENASAF